MRGASVAHSTAIISSHFLRTYLTDMDKVYAPHEIERRIYERSESHVGPKIGITTDAAKMKPSRDIYRYAQSSAPVQQRANVASS
jgi:hypothetical protein